MFSLTNYGELGNLMLYVVCRGWHTKGTKIYNVLGHPLFVMVIGLRGVQFGEWSAIRL